MDSNNRNKYFIPITNRIPSNLNESQSNGNQIALGRVIGFRNLKFEDSQNLLSGDNIKEYLIDNVDNLFIFAVLDNGILLPLRLCIGEIPNNNDIVAYNSLQPIYSSWTTYESMPVKNSLILLSQKEAIHSELLVNSYARDDNNWNNGFTYSITEKNENNALKKQSNIYIDPNKISIQYISDDSGELKIATATINDSIELQTTKNDSTIVLKKIVADNDSTKIQINDSKKNNYRKK